MLLTSLNETEKIKIKGNVGMMKGDAY